MKNNAKHWQHALAVTGTVFGLMVPATTTVARGEGQSGCHVVVLETHVTGVFPNFSGTITGDLEGSVEVVLGDVTDTGNTLHIPGEQTWVISGGIIPELVGSTLSVEFTGVQVFAPGQGSTSVINGRSRITSGADRGGLTFHGTFDRAVFPFAVDLEYRGQVCP